MRRLTFLWLAMALMAVTLQGWPQNPPAPPPGFLWTTTISGNTIAATLTAHYVTAEEDMLLAFGLDRTSPAVRSLIAREMMAGAGVQGRCACPGGFSGSLGSPPHW
jgi:hypothetical protein